MISTNRKQVDTSMESNAKMQFPWPKCLNDPKTHVWLYMFHLGKGDKLLLCFFLR